MNYTGDAFRNVFLRRHVKGRIMGVQFTPTLASGVMEI
jgi:hypothetical protein